MWIWYFHFKNPLIIYLIIPFIGLFHWKIKDIFCCLCGNMIYQTFKLSNFHNSVKKYLLKVLINKLQYQWVEESHFKDFYWKSYKKSTIKLIKVKWFIKFSFFRFLCAFVIELFWEIRILMWRFGSHYVNHFSFFTVSST